MYPEDLVAPMRQETVDMGLTELKTSDEVEKALANEGTSLVFVNSVCGCAAGMARPGLALALSIAKNKPDHLYSVFAGNDAEATAAARANFHGYPPTSPCIGLLKNGKLAAIVQRYDIEGSTAEEVADKLTAEFDKYCKQ
jgi:putative YphP/YqiW family bacilliredoxin